MQIVKSIAEFEREYRRRQQCSLEGLSQLFQRYGAERPLR